MFFALLLTTLAVLLQECHGDNHCPNPTNPCLPMNFYEINGYCNNHIQKRAGSKASPYARYVTRLSYAGAPKHHSFMGSQPLPSPRNVSLEFFPCHDGTTSAATHLFAIFGQLVMFDLFDTERNSTADGCCTTGSDCYGIDTDTNNDPRNPNCTCINYNRPTLIKNIECMPVDREGKNKITHVMDLSFLYSPIHHPGYSPPGPFAPTSTFFLGTGNPITGVSDPINKNPLVFALSQVFMKAHNNLVNKIAMFGVPNPPGEARKLLIGIFQHITYNEYLPMLLGTNTSVKSLTTGTRTYDPQKLPMVFNSFSLAYKLAMASMMRESVTINSTPSIALNNILGDATQIDTATKIANIIVGMLIDKSLKIGKQIPCAFRNNCSYPDLVSILSQDTRLFGIPTYYIWLHIMNSLPPENLDLHSNSTKTQLLNFYGNVFDIGFLPGTFTEEITGPSMLGPTLTKLFEEQFKKLKEGDRLFYENKDVFESYQLTEIRKMTMSRLLCSYVDGLNQVKEMAFDHASTDVNCSSLPDIDFCEYHCISRTWSDFEPAVPDVLCVTLRAEVRYCKSTNPTLCKCEGVPFRLAPCPNALTEKSMIGVLKMLEVSATNDSEVMNYYETRNMHKLVKRLEELYGNLTG